MIASPAFMCPSPFALPLLSRFTSVSVCTSQHTCTHHLFLPVLPLCEVLSLYHTLAHLVPSPLMPPLLFCATYHFLLFRPPFSRNVSSHSQTLKVLAKESLTRE